MKKLLTISFMLAFINIFAIHHSSHHSSHHSISHCHSFYHPSCHTTNSNHINKQQPSYKPVSRLNEYQIHTYLNNSNLYYYLLFNHNTNRYDTIKAKSKEELEDNVKYLSNSGKPNYDVIITILIIFGAILIITLIYLVFQKISEDIP